MDYLKALARIIDRTNEMIGNITSWLAVIMVIVQFVVVVMRYVFGIGSIMLQESIIYMHGTLFMMGAAFTLLRGGHVRVDVIYREASDRFKAFVDLFGSVVFLIPVCYMIFWVSFGYVSNSWAVFEGSKETSGIQGVFLLKTAILLFAGLMIAQGISMAINAIFTLSGFSRDDHEKTVAEG